MSAIPPPPINLRVVADSTTSLTFSWDAPVQPNELLSGYLLTLQSNHIFFRIYYTMTTFHVINLNPSTEYHASIQATNDNFETFSEPVYFLPIHPGQTVPRCYSSCSAQRISHTNALVTWSSPLSFIGPEVKWVVIESVSNHPEDPVRAISADPFRQNEYTVTDLNPLSIYTFTIYAVSILGYSSPIQTNSVVLFEPNFIPGCMMWLDASDSSTILQTEQGTVSTWLDKSGHLRNPIGNGQTYTGTSIQFTNHFMSINCPFQPRQTVVLVAKSSSTQSTQYLYNERDDSSVPSIIANYTDNWIEYLNGTDRATFTITPTSCFLSAFVYEQGRTIKGYFNSSTPIFTIPQTQTSTFPMEYSRLGSEQSIDAQICEIIIYNGILTDTNWNMLVGYLKQKWHF